ncbi:hypothetical protein [Zoogloea sp. LCSB751]|uniref:hypothetical protein n=1 Tax=Zoogloea sp. LCSB751 TaxID=1965277 RepID=UPI0009A50EA5|nr:hypothetical protein [Zoogloea sp. LCSB751]
MAKRLDVLAALATRLRAATAARQWVAVGRIDSDVAALLAGLHKGCPLSGAEQQAVDALAAVHRMARESCAEEAARLERRLTEMCAHRDGWMAYAMAEYDLWEQRP